MCWTYLKNPENFVSVLQNTWVRPEDIDFYSQYVDVCEFFGNMEQVPILLKIYKEDKKWFDGEVAEGGE